MRIPNWFKRGSPLQGALKRGLLEGGRLPKEIEELGDYPIKSRADALAICQALEWVQEGRVDRGKSFTSPLHALTGLFQDIESTDCAAFAVLRERGSALLASLVNQGLSQNGLYPDDDLLFMLKILAQYGTEEGAEAILRAARKPLAPDAYMWSVILGAFQAGHPEAVRVFAGLSDPLPNGFVAVALLDAANRFALDGGELQHPFDSDEGVARLGAWLSDTDPEHASYAVSATAALPFLNHAGQHRLLNLAMEHKDGAIALEAAWAAAKMGEPRGFELLARLCLDVNRSTQARLYLEELHRGDVVPAEALAPDFQARAEFAHWLAHPNELGCAPDEVEILDHRELPWPPEFEPKPLYLIRYRAKAASELDEDDVGVGLVGGVTFCFFSYHLDQRPPEDGYAIHCCWELERANLFKCEAVEEDSTEYDSLLAQWPGQPLEATRVEHVAELSPQLKHPRRLVAVASARAGTAAGWVVLDGHDSRWYLADELPPEERGETVLKIHLGRMLLGLPATGCRKDWLRPPAPRPREHVVAGYERLLSSFEEVSTSAETQARSAYDLLNRHFEAYVAALVQMRGGSREDHLIAAYERLLRAARRAALALGDGAFRASSALGQQFEPYVDALAALGRHADIRALVAFFAPLWEHNLGYGQLGSAAFKAGDLDSAEACFLKLKDGMEDWQRSDEMGLLAEIWCRKGRRAEARSLLLECLKGLVAQSRGQTGSDRRLYEHWFQNQRGTFLKLFPDGAAELAANGVPETTRTPTG